MIKKMLLAVPVAAVLMFSSCGGGGCDTSTADGAAKCYCDMMKEFDSVKDDEAKAKEFGDKIDKLENEVEKNIEEGKYSENDIEEAAKKIEGCNL